MASWLIAGIGVVYLLVAVQLLVEGKIGLGIAFLGYALGNVGSGGDGFYTGAHANTTLDPFEQFGPPVNWNILLNQ